MGQRILFGLVVFLTASAIYLYAFPQQNVFYAVIVLLHLAAGVVATLVLLPMLGRLMREGSWLSTVGWALFLVGAGLGFWLVHTGTLRSEWKWMYAHVVVCAAALAFLITERTGRRFEAATIGHALMRLAACIVVIAGLGAGMRYLREARWANHARIENPDMPPPNMEAEGDGPQGPFFPSSAQVYGHKKIPSKFFMESDSCKRCHEDIYNQWFSSAHHFSSFNNQWYRKSIEYMQDVAGVKSSKWCAGCHDPALLFSGMFDTPIRQIENTPAGQAGLSCMMCHSIVEVKSTMGQGDFVLEYPKLHELAASENPVVRALHDFMVKVNPEPHRRVFLKPFMREQTAEFCSGCHKVHLDLPVNRYRWIRGFNEYDNWQASGVSGQGARSFYYPANSKSCADCHMPLIPSKDEGSVDGLVHSHRFPGANTAVPTANGDAEQLAASTKFLQDKQVSVDIFGIAPAEKAGAETKGNVPHSGQELSTTFAVGEEAEAAGPRGAEGNAKAITAPLGRVDAAVRRGDDVNVEVVVRTRNVGHFFPGGTVDAFEVWLELQATDEKGLVIFWSGRVGDDGKGQVDEGAHFYRSRQIDGHGNVINKRNAWSTRAVVYVHLIPPGAADTVHYRLHVPENAGEKITLHAKVNYRKFMWFNNQFSYAGVEDASAVKGEVTPNYDDRKWAFTGDTSGVAGKLKEVPTLPITVVAQDTKDLRVIGKKEPAPAPHVVTVKEDWTRWNDYGIGLFLQGDLRNAGMAFENVTQADAQNPDGWVNIGRVRAQEGDNAGAVQVLDKALALRPGLARANYFYARVLKEDGKYEEAIAKLQSVLQQYPRDRVVWNELGRIYFLQKKYADAVKAFQSTLTIDPEDLQAHYNLMLCYNGLGDDARAEQHKARYLRYKADESAQALTGPYRQAHPEDNNERQMVHEHVSVALGAAPKAAAKKSVRNAPAKSAIATAGGGR
jgi:Flp pilus assembly protein TadD